MIYVRWNRNEENIIMKQQDGILVIIISNDAKNIEKSIDKVEELKQKAIASLNSIEDSQYKNALIKITDYTLSRS